MRALRGWLRFPMSLLLLAAFLPGCATYSVMPDPASALQAPQDQVKWVRITLRNGEEVRLQSPRVVGDSLRGTWPDALVRSVPLDSVAAVQVKGVSPERTTLVVIAGAAVAAWTVIGIMVLTGTFD